MTETAHPFHSGPDSHSHDPGHRQLMTLRVNGETYELLTEARRTLVDVLRHDLRLTGTHVGCEHGICGACTVLLDGRPVRACLMFAAQAEEMEIRTVESLSDGRELNDLQRAFSEHHGLQCGFCTPGFLMLAEGYLAERPQATKEEIREVVASNLCRCTGYQTIVEAIDDCATRRRAALQQRLDEARPDEAPPDGRHSHGTQPEDTRPDGTAEQEEVPCGSTTRSR
ncbi:(2Fe-2S)-binding protein [Streptomyces bathyalis]|uniref:(2Fe-2S)-binding protein n=1 Tax=Streptomyces bathyalis TaxID=2710756 RepID=A0A7T1T4A8_9ACTN|nr:(2Fe-2S)-binding protein [Streptomyces bathyalis]